MRNVIIAHRGSIQAITTIPAELRELYKTVWEVKMKTLIDMAKDRGAFICQSQSLNLYMAGAHRTGLPTTPHHPPVSLSFPLLVMVSPPPPLCSP
jgi:ribonucleoside-diphosphate reductase alpha chain